MTPIHYQVWLYLWHILRIIFSHSKTDWEEKKNLGYADMLSSGFLNVLIFQRAHGGPHDTDVASSGTG